MASSTVREAALNLMIDNSIMIGFLDMVVIKNPILTEQSHATTGINPWVYKIEIKRKFVTMMSHKYGVLAAIYLQYHSTNGKCEGHYDTWYIT